MNIGEIQRCAVYLDGYYEWAVDWSKTRAFIAHKDEEKDAYFIRMK